MKKVSFMKLNLQQENLLSKEERKKILAGTDPGTCYVICNGSPARRPIASCNSEMVSYACELTGAKCCGCNGDCY